MSSRLNGTTILLLIIVALQSVSACTPVRMKPETTIAPTGNSLQETPIPSPTRELPVLPPSPTWIPTLSSLDQTNLAKLLQSDNCKLPCYLGIQPGKTKSTNARILLNGLGASFFSSYSEGDYYVDEFHLDVGDESLLMNTPTSDSVKRISHWIRLVIDKNEIIQQIRVGVQAEVNYVSKFQNYWSRYSARILLVNYGMPNQMNAWASYGGGYGLAFIYDKKGIVIELNGSTQGVLLCPGIETKVAGLHFTLTSPASKISIFDPDLAPPTDINHWFSIEKVVGIDEKEFYNQINANPSVCFPVKNYVP